MMIDDGKDWIAIEGDYRANILSVRAIGRKYGVSEGNIRKRAGKSIPPWTRDPNATKLAIVKAHFAGDDQTPKTPSTRSPQKSTHPPVRDRVPPSEPDAERVEAQYAPVRRTPQRHAATSIQDAAQQDIEDMEMGLLNARQALITIGEYFETQFSTRMDDGRMPDPRNLKALIDANGAAIEQIRRIRGLDSKIGDELEALKVLMTAGWIPDELLVSAFSEYRRLKPAIKTTFNKHFEPRLEVGHSEN